MGLTKQFIRLSLFFFFLLFLSGRIGLFLHEFAGHALFLHLFDGKISEFNLFIFGGGRVHYGHTLATSGLAFFPILSIHLSGIVVELISGILLLIPAIFLKTGRPLKGLFISTSSVLIVHSLFYFTISIYYGSGDGRLLFDVLHGGLRQMFLLLAFSLTMSGACIVSCAFSPVVLSWAAQNTLNKRVLTVVICAFSAATLHGALTIGEQVVIKDRVYADIKTPENVRLKRRALSEFVEAYTEKHGREPNPQQIEVVQNELEDKYRQFPIEIALGVAVLIAFAAGLFFSMRKNDNGSDPISWSDIQFLGCLSVISITFILFLNRL